MTQAQRAEELPELLGLLAFELRRELEALLPDRGAERLDALAIDLAQAASDRIGGQRPPIAPHVAAADLPAADAAYAVLADVWCPQLASVAGMPTEWLRVAVSRLLDIARGVLGGQYIPKWRAARTAALAESLWERFRGDIRAVAIEHNISGTRARQLLAARLAAERDKRQGKLFDD